MTNKSPQCVVLFDLDGTLLDSIEDLTGAANHLLRDFKAEPLATDQVRGFVGNGVRTLVERVLNARGIVLSTAKLTTAYERMVGLYQSNLTNQSSLLPGARSAVETLAASNYQMAVVTNKPQQATEEILAHFQLDHAVSAVVGGDLGLTPKPAPDMIFHALALLDSDARFAIMVGDSGADVGAAKAAGVKSIAVEGGYSNIPASDLGADVVIQSLENFSLPLIHSLVPGS